MGEIKEVKLAKLVIGIFGVDFSLVKPAEEKLVKKFKRIDYESHILSFDITDYYQAEMGSNLKRKFYAFERLISPNLLPRIKIFTNRLEKKLAKRNGQRQFNIDPGYLTLSKFVLATTKDYSHRLYLNKGIYAEVTLKFKDETFQPWEWTYPDYRQKEYLEIFNKIRKIYKEQLKR